MFIAKLLDGVDSAGCISPVDFGHAVAIAFFHAGQASIPVCRPNEAGIGSAKANDGPGPGHRRPLFEKQTDQCGEGRGMGWSYGRRRYGGAVAPPAQDMFSRSRQTV